MASPDNPGYQEEIQYGCAFEIDGHEHIELCSSLEQAHSRIGNLIRHHKRHAVSAENYRVVSRTVQVGPWQSHGH